MGTPRVPPCAPRPVQLRHECPLSGEAYVARSAWRDASLAACPRHPRGGCGLVRHGTYPRRTPVGMRIARYYCPTAHETFSLLPDCLASHLPGELAAVESVVVTVDALPGFVTEGEVNRIAPQVDARSRSFEIIIRVPGRPQLVSGLFARAQVKVRDVPGSLTVPPAALLRDGSDPTKAQTYVVVNNKVERRDVLVGVEVPDAVQVTNGLKAGEVVVVDPPSALGPGTRVQVERDVKAGS